MTSQSTVDHTFPFDYFILDFPFPLRPVRLRLVDGVCLQQQQSPAGVKAAFSHSAGCVLVYDVNDRSTFDRLPQYVDLARQHLVEMERINPVQWVVCGNKAGEEGRQQHRQVSAVEGEQWARSNGFDFFETSCVTGWNVREAFHQLAARIYELIKHTQYNMTEQQAKLEHSIEPNTSSTNRSCALLSPPIRHTSKHGYQLGKVLEKLQHN